jgi:hypothetical protein
MTADFQLQIQGPLPSLLMFTTSLFTFSRQLAIGNWQSAMR